MLHGSTLLSVALAMARRMGLNHDGTHFPLSPWKLSCGGGCGTIWYFSMPGVLRTTVFSR